MIHDPESTEVMLYMVKKGKEVLKTVHNYDRYRQVLAQQIDEEDYFQERQEQKEGIYSMGKNRVEGGINMINKYVCGKEDTFTNDDDEQVPADDFLTMDHRVDIYVEEVLRFLAMKIFLENGLITAAEEGENVDPNAHNDTAAHGTTEAMLNHYNNFDSTNANGLPILQLHPSQPIRYGWKMMLLFPLIYADVCAAMGSPSYLDYSSEEEDDDELNDVLSTKMWKLECYHWTLDTYDNLFHGRPSRHFWPMVKMDITRKGEFIWNETRDCKCIPLRVNLTPQSPTARVGYVATSSEITSRRQTSRTNKNSMYNGASVSSINPREILDKVQKPIMEGYQRWREPCVAGGKRARDTCQAFEMRDEGLAKPWRDQSSIPECINVKYR